MENVESISFHSWGHFFSTYIEPKLTHSELQKVTGHPDEKMLEHYTDHETEIALEHVGSGPHTENDTCVSLCHFQCGVH